MTLPASTPRKPQFLSAVRDTSAAPAHFAQGTVLGKRPDPAPAPLPAPAPVPPPSPVSQSGISAEGYSQHALERLELAISLLRSQGERLAELARSDALELGFVVARRILESELHGDPSALQRLIRSTLERAGEASHITVRLNPRSVAALEAMGHGDPASVISVAKVEIVADPSLEHGDCVVDTDLGQIDGRLATRLSELREAVALTIERANDRNGERAGDREQPRRERGSARQTEKAGA